MKNSIENGRGWMQQKYQLERDKRLDHVRRTYVDVSARLPAPRIQNSSADIAHRDPIVEEADVLIIGCGISGLCTAVELRKAGIDRIRMIDDAADFGGTWYWSRYPGAACDIESYIYLPLLEETGYIPTEKYACAGEIYEYLRQLGARFLLYEKATFQTRVTHLHWDEECHRWVAVTNRFDVISARFVCLALGGLSQPRLPNLKGIESFSGHSFHACRWDYDYTGGDSRGRLTSMMHRRVGVVGTGATAVQVIPHLADWSKHVYVFQRTPSAVHPRCNRATDIRWARSLRPGWQRHRIRNFQKALMGPVLRDLVDDSWTEISRGLYAADAHGLIVNGTHDVRMTQQAADFKKMDEVRRRIDEVVRDPVTAAALKPYYNLFCKRPCFHDSYLETFNRSNVTLVDTDGRGLDSITSKGVVATGREYELDCIIYATGFDVAKLPFQSRRFDVLGTGGLSLRDKWNLHFGSLHGILIHGFPNMMVVGGFRDAAASVNGTYIFEGQARHIVRIIARCFETRTLRMEVTREAEERWAQSKRELQDSHLYRAIQNCTPGLVAGEGAKGGGSLSLAAELYPGDPEEYFDTLESWMNCWFDRDTVTAHSGKVTK